jgi:hypothetical protein
MKLHNVSLISVCGNEKYKEPTKRAMRHCLKKLDFEDVFLLSNENDDEFPTKKIPVLDQALYSQFCVESLKDYINTDYCMMIQWDGFIIKENLWNDEFLKYDYIGAPWPYHDHAVGNGGFCIRSKKFLEYSSRLKYSSDIPFQAGVPGGVLVTPEDWFLCIHNYDYMLYNGINFAPAKLGYQFSVEHSCSPRFNTSLMKIFNPQDINTYNCFGFHGSFNTAAMKELS